MTKYVFVTNYIHWLSNMSLCLTVAWMRVSACTRTLPLHDGKWAIHSPSKSYSSYSGPATSYAFHKEVIKWSEQQRNSSSSNNSVKIFSLKVGWCASILRSMLWFTRRSLAICFFVVHIFRVLLQNSCVLYLLVQFRDIFALLHGFFYCSPEIIVIFMKIVYIFSRFPASSCLWILDALVNENNTRCVITLVQIIAYKRFGINVSVNKKCTWSFFLDGARFGQMVSS